MVVHNPLDAEQLPLWEVPFHWSFASRSIFCCC